MYNDEQTILDSSNIAQMAKEYVIKQKEKQLEIIAEPLEQLYNNLLKLEDGYSYLLRMAKINAITFAKNLLKSANESADSLKEIYPSLCEKNVILNSTNDYIKLFKNCLNYEILSLKYCYLCVFLTKNAENENIFNEILKKCEHNIKELIKCF